MKYILYGYLKTIELGFEKSVDKFWISDKLSDTNVNEINLLTT